MKPKRIIGGRSGIVRTRAKKKELWAKSPPCVDNQDKSQIEIAASKPIIGTLAR